MREAVIGELGPVLASGEVQVRLAGPDVVEPGPGSDGDEVPDGAPGLVLEVRFPGDLPADQAEKRAAVIATRMSQSTALRRGLRRGPGGHARPLTATDRPLQPARRQMTGPVSFSPGP